VVDTERPAEAALVAAAAIEEKRAREGRATVALVQEDAVWGLALARRAAGSEERVAEGAEDDPKGRARAEDARPRQTTTSERAHMSADDGETMVTPVTRAASRGLRPLCHLRLPWV
jgi:hypothetical protein